MTSEKAMSHTSIVETMKQHASDVEKPDPDVIDFEEHDAEHPHNWPALKKWLIVMSFALMNMIDYFATTTIMPAAPQVIDDLNITSTVYRTLLVSIWELGEGFGPFLIGPLSEKFGRLPVYHIGNLLGLMCAVGGALSINISMLVAFRFLSGCTSVALTLSPAVIGDLFPTDQRGTVMAIETALGFVGAVIAPIAGSYLAQDLGWRWTIWIVVIAIAAIAGPSVLLVRETYEVVILERKAARLRRETGNACIRSPYHEHNSLDLRAFFRSLTTPIRTLLHSAVVFLTAFYTAVSYALTYLLLTTLTEVMEQTYGFNHGVVGLTFLACATGSIMAMIFYGCTSDRYITYRKKQKNGDIDPENRLIFVVIGSITLPLGFFLYGWTLSPHIHWIVPLLGTAVVCFSSMLAMLSTGNYLVDAFGIHSASAVSAGVIIRAIFGAVLPLAGPAAYDSLGFGWGNSLWAFLALAFVPFIIALAAGNRKRHRKQYLAV